VAGLEAGHAFPAIALRIRLGPLATIPCCSPASSGSVEFVGLEPEYSDDDDEAA